MLSARTALIRCVGIASVNIIESGRPSIESACWKNGDSRMRQKMARDGGPPSNVGTSDFRTGLVQNASWLVSGVALGKIIWRFRLSCGQKHFTSRGFGVNRIVHAAASHSL